MNNRNHTLTIIATLLSLSCKKVVQVDLDNASSQVVITGEVTNTPGPYKVFISRTVNFSDLDQFPPVTDAFVIITDNKGLTDTLTSTAPGVYTTHPGWQGAPGTTYTLHVTIDSAAYSASSTMPPPVSLDSVGFEDDARFRKTRVQAVPYFQDPPGIHNYYYFTETINGVPRDRDFIFDDRLSDGKYVHQPLHDDSTRLQIGDNLLLSMSCIDSAVYSYLNTLQQNTNPSQSQSTAPSNPNTNLSGGALGYFNAHTIEYKQVIVP